jgi:Domain of unknown function (DUF5666)
MKHFSIAAVALVLGLVSGADALAHGNNDHVRGVVTQVSAQSITVQLANNTSKTLTVSPKTTFQRSGKAAAMTDVKVGDRVVIDVPKNSTEALEVQIGAAKAAAPAAAHDAAHK